MFFFHFQSLDSNFRIYELTMKCDVLRIDREHTPSPPPVYTYVYVHVYIQAKVESLGAVSLLFETGLQLTKSTLPPVPISWALGFQSWDTMSSFLVQDAGDSTHRFRPSWLHYKRCYWLGIFRILCAFPHSSKNKLTMWHFKNCTSNIYILPAWNWKQTAEKTK